MKFRTMGLVVCMLAGASTANAGYAWSDFQGNSDNSKATVVKHGSSGVSRAPAARVTGYAWSDLQGNTGDSKAPVAKKAGHARRQLHANSGVSKTPIAKVTGYAWSD
jgi:hypothetical protein